LTGLRAFFETECFYRRLSKTLEMKTEDERTKAARTYNSASDHYDDPANSFWERFGHRTVERLELRPGMRVLDVCCGSGASALAAAEAVGPNGYVLGVDLAENLLALGRSKAKSRNFRQAEFRTGDMLNLSIPETGFDAVVCVFGIFFVSDMAEAVRQLWQRVAIGGRLAITTWGPRFFEPLNTEFWNSVRRVRPDLYKAFQPWERIAEPEALEDLMIAAGVKAPHAVPETGVHLLRTPDDWWTMMLGSGYRATVDQLDPGARELVRNENLDFIRATNTLSVEANVVYGVALK
jgi:ubiquinone/menaquinone biosynthesis C-methylase UbiE